MLAVLTREPFSGVTPAVYATLTDWQILHVLFAARDDEHRLIPLRRRLAGEHSSKPPGHPDNAAGELRSDEELGIDEEALAVGRTFKPRAIPLGFMRMWFQQRRDHGLSVEKVRELWKTFVARENAVGR